MVGRLLSLPSVFYESKKVLPLKSRFNHFFMKKLLLLLAFGWSVCAFGADTITVHLNDGECFLGRLSLPAGKKDVPLVVVFIPDAGPNTYLNTGMIGETVYNYFDLFESEFNKRGIGFLSYNRRGVTLNEKPPHFYQVDSAKFARYNPKREVLDVEAMISTLKDRERLQKANIVLMGTGEGAVIAARIVERMVEDVVGLMLFDYASDLTEDAIRLVDIDIPIYLFRGTKGNQAATDVAIDLQHRFELAKKTNLKSFVFEGHDQELNYLDWPTKKQISEGLKSMFDTTTQFVR